VTKRTEGAFGPTLSIPKDALLPQSVFALIPVHLERGDEGFLRDVDLAE
jgi:hypothetical protein